MKVQWKDGADGACLCTYDVIGGERLAKWLLKFGHGGCGLGYVRISEAPDFSHAAVSPTSPDGKLTPDDCLGRPFIARYLAAVFAGVLAAFGALFVLMRFRPRAAD